MSLATDVAGRTFGCAWCLARLSAAGLPLVSVKFCVTKFLDDSLSHQLNSHISYVKNYSPWSQGREHHPEGKVYAILSMQRKNDNGTEIPGISDIFKQTKNK